MMRRLLSTTTDYTLDSVAADPVNSSVFLSSSGPSLSRVDVNSSLLPNSIIYDFKNDSDVSSVFSFSPTDRNLCALLEDSSLKLLRLSSSGSASSSIIIIIATLVESPVCLAWGSSSLLAVGCQTGDVIFFSLDQQQQQQQQQGETSAAFVGRVALSTSAPQSLHFSEDGNFLACVCASSGCVIVDLRRSTSHSGSNDNSSWPSILCTIQGAGVCTAAQFTSQQRGPFKLPVLAVAFGWKTWAKSDYVVRIVDLTREQQQQLLLQQQQKQSPGRGGVWCERPVEAAWQRSAHSSSLVAGNNSKSNNSLHEEKEEEDFRVTRKKQLVEQLKVHKQRFLQRTGRECTTGDLRENPESAGLLCEWQDLTLSLKADGRIDGSLKWSDTMSLFCPTQQQGASSSSSSSPQKAIDPRIYRKKQLEQQLAELREDFESQFGRRCTNRDIMDNSHSAPIFTELQSIRAQLGETIEVVEPARPAPVPPRNQQQQSSWSLSVTSSPSKSTAAIDTIGDAIDPRVQRKKLLADQLLSFKAQFEDQNGRSATSRDLIQNGEASAMVKEYQAIKAELDHERKSKQQQHHSVAAEAEEHKVIRLHTGFITSLDFFRVGSDDDKKVYLMSCAEDHRVAVWDLNQLLSSSSTAIAPIFSQEVAGTRAVVLTDGNRVVVYDPKKPIVELYSLELEEAASRAVLAASPPSRSSSSSLQHPLLLSSSAPAAKAHLSAARSVSSQQPIVELVHDGCSACAGEIAFLRGQLAESRRQHEMQRAEIEQLQKVRHDQIELLRAQMRVLETQQQ